MSTSVWEDVKAKRQSEKERRDAKKNQTYTSESFEQYVMMALHKDGKKNPRTEKVFRIVGNPAEHRENPEDAKIIYQSRIVRDDGKGYNYIIWNTVLNEDGKPELDNNWILMKLYNKVYESNWKNYTDEEKAQRNDQKRGEYIRKHDGTKSYVRLDVNSKEGEMYPTKVWPKERVILNVIDRMDAWCKENKHTKLLFSSVGTIKKDDGTTADVSQQYGVPKQGFYDLIFDNVVQYHGHWDIDIVALSTGNINNSYIVKDATDKKIDPASKKLVVETPLTDEEKAYVRYNVDKIFQVSSYQKLRKNLIGLFKMVDSEFGTTFTEELNTLADKEQADYAKKAETNGNGSVPKDISQAVPQEEEIVPRPARKAPVVDGAIEDKAKQLFPKWDQIDADDRKEVLEWLLDSDKGLPVWKDKVNLVECDDAQCKFPNTSQRSAFPGTVLKCAVCGITFKLNG